MPYHFLADDLDFLNDGFETNINRSDSQLESYPKPSKGKTISHEQYGRETGNDKTPLCLYAADGYDDQPVGSLGYRAARAFWYMGSDHIFPPQIDLIRIAFFFHLDIHEAAFLVLKGEWERYFAKENGYTTGMGEKFTAVMTMESEAELVKAFTVDSGAIFTTILSQLRMVRGSAMSGLKDGAGWEWERLRRLHYEKYDEKSFRALLQEMILNKFYHEALDAPLVRDFFQKKRGELETLQNGTPAQQQEFWMLKCTWLELQEQLGDVLLAVERSRLRNAHVVTDFLKIFGDIYVKLQELVIRVRTLENRIMLKETRPELSEKEVLAALQAQEDQDEKMLAELSRDADMAPWIDGDEPTGPVEPDQLRDYYRQIKKILREIYFLFHEDYLQNHPDYNRLTDAEKNHLKALFQRAMAIKKESELCYKEGSVGYETRSLGELLDILSKAKIIIKHAGLDVRTEYVIQGESIGERMVWLEREIRRLEKGITDARGGLIALNANRDILEKKAILDCPVQHERVHAEMQQRVDEYRKELDRLEAQYCELFGGMAS